MCCMAMYLFRRSARYTFLCVCVCVRRIWRPVQSCHGGYVRGNNAADAVIASNETMR